MVNHTRMRRFVEASVVVAALIGPMGCGQRGVDTGSGETARAGEAAARVGRGPASIESVGAPVTEEECWAFANALEMAVASGDLNGVQALIDWQAIGELATAGIDAPAEVRAKFIQGVTQESQHGQGLVPVLVDAVRRGGAYAPLHLDASKPHRTVMFRLLPPDGGVNYHNFVLARRPDGSVKAIDIDVFVTGEYFSQTLRSSYLPLAAHSRRNLLDRLTGKEQAMVTHMPDLTRMVNDLRQGRYEAVLQTYRQLPEELRQSKNCLILRFSAAQGISAETLDDREYMATIEDFQRLYPGDPCLDLISVDGYLLRGHHDEALACVDRIDQAVGGDPFLDVLRANVYLDRGDLDTAEVTATGVLEQEPYLLDAYWVLLTVSLERQNFDETARLLDVLREEFGMEFHDLNTVPEYAAFVQSPQYDDWLARQSGSL